MIKILKDICVLQPDFPQISDICVRMIRRIGDEEGIKVTIYYQTVLVTHMDHFIHFFLAQ